MFWVALMLSVAFFSCSEQENITTEPAVQTPDYFVPQNEASALATVIAHPQTTKNPNNTVAAKGTETLFKNVESLLPVPDPQGHTAYYIINYKEGGYIMLSADKRTHPIRAYSHTGKFPVEEATLPAGLIDWLAETSDFVGHIRATRALAHPAVARTWDSCEMDRTLAADSTKKVCEEENQCENTVYTKGPLVKSDWGQLFGFNELSGDTPNSCPGNPNNNPPTSCVATAMAQVMKYHRHPTTYDWDTMDDRFGGNQTPKLMKDIAIAVGMDWGCGRSSAEDDDIPPAFKQFGYRNVKRSAFNRERVISELESNRPVLLSAFESKIKKNCFLWWCSYQYKKGHVWVCDGSKASTFYSEDCSIGWGYLYFHMNWGWGDDDVSRALNGWYSYNSWKPGKHDYKYKKGIIYNIKP